jgi:hypothetical protein
VGLFREPDLENAAAAALVHFYGSDGSARAWFRGEEEVLVHGAAIYLDWAVNKDRRADALRFLAAARHFFRPGKERSQFMAFPFSVSHAWEADLGEREPTSAASATVAIAFSNNMRCECAFRPRRSVARLLYSTFWALWNELVLVLGPTRGDWATLEALHDNVALQLDYYDAHGIGAFRGGIAPILASSDGYAEQIQDGRQPPASLLASEEQGIAAHEPVTELTGAPFPLDPHITEDRARLWAEQVAESFDEEASEALPEAIGRAAEILAWTAALEMKSADPHALSSGLAPLIRGGFRWRAAEHRIFGKESERVAEAYDRVVSLARDDEPAPFLAQVALDGYVGGISVEHGSVPGALGPELARLGGACVVAYVQKQEQWLGNTIGSVLPDHVAAKVHLMAAQGRSELGESMQWSAYVFGLSLYHASTAAQRAGRV